MRRTEPDSINLGEQRLVSLSEDDSRVHCTVHNENIYEVLFRSWHDEAYLYINQAITQEKPNIDRKDVALMMYQKGLGLVDLALCVDTEVKITSHCWLALCLCFTLIVVVRAGTGLGQSSHSPTQNVSDQSSCGI